MNIAKMCYSIEPRDGFLSFAKNIGKNISNKYSQKLVGSAKKSATDAIKTASQRAIQKTAETTGHLIDNKIADNIANVSKDLQNNCIHQNCHQVNLIRKYQKKDIYISTRKKTNY